MSTFWRSKRKILKIRNVEKDSRTNLCFQLPREHDEACFERWKWLVSVPTEWGNECLPLLPVGGLHGNDRISQPSHHHQLMCVCVHVYILNCNECKLSIINSINTRSGTCFLVVTALLSLKCDSPLYRVALIAAPVMAKPAPMPTSLFRKAIFSPYTWTLQLACA